MDSTNPKRIKKKSKDVLNIIKSRKERSQHISPEPKPPVVSMGSASREDIVTSPMPIADTAGPELFDRTSTLHSPVLGISSPSDHFRHSDMQSLSPGHMSSAKRIENAFSSQRSVIVDQTRRMEELTRTLDEERTAKNRIQHQFTDYRE
ncbi:hypothetical protein ADUPG1_009173, partial [Aduncisulcus paluster]